MKAYKFTELQHQLLMESQVAYGPKKIAKIDNAHSLMEVSRSGITYIEFYQWAREFNLSSHDWAELLHMPYRTFNRYKAENRLFRDHYADRILRIFSFINAGIQFFGDRDIFFQWLKMPSFHLGNNTPFSYMDSSFGVDYLIDYLGRMEHGVFA